MLKKEHELIGGNNKPKKEDKKDYSLDEKESAAKGKRKRKNEGIKSSLDFEGISNNKIIDVSNEPNSDNEDGQKKRWI